MKLPRELQNYVLTVPNDNDPHFRPDAIVVEQMKAFIAENKRFLPQAALDACSQLSFEVSRGSSS
jgi:hypothetical protein